MNQTTEKKKFFGNPVVEILAWTNFPFHLIFYSSLALGYCYMGANRIDVELPVLFGLFIAGVLFWTIIEYLMHRFVFHFVSENKFIKLFHYIFHGVHHDNPRDKSKTIMPPVPGLIITGLYLGFIYLFIGDYAFPVVGGITIGYLVYSSLHYAIHQFSAPKFLQPLWTHHLIHHYKDPDSAFGVSSRVWDKVFNTMPDDPEGKNKLQ